MTDLSNAAAVVQTVGEGDDEVTSKFKFDGEEKERVEINKRDEEHSYKII